jgi:hypothetical protein
MTRFWFIEKPSSNTLPVRQHNNYKTTLYRVRSGFLFSSSLSPHSTLSHYLFHSFSFVYLYGLFNDANQTFYNRLSIKRDDSHCGTILKYMVRTRYRIMLYEHKTVTKTRSRSVNLLYGFAVENRSKVVAHMSRSATSNYIKFRFTVRV